MFKIPRKMNIIGHMFDISKQPEAVMKDALGLCFSDDNKIFIRRGLEKQKEREVFLHEVVHAISELLDLKFSEHQVESFTVGLYQVLKENNISFNKRSKHERKGNLSRLSLAKERKQLCKKI